MRQTRKTTKNLKLGTKKWEKKDKKENYTILDAKNILILLYLFYI